MTLQKTTEQLFNSFALEGKITEQHAKEIKEILSGFVVELKEEAIQRERERILLSAEKILEEEKRAYGTDKHGLSLDQLKEILDN